MFFVGRAVKTRQNVQNGPKISCETHLLLECCMLIGLLGWGKLDLIRALDQSNIWRLCCLTPILALVCARTLARSGLVLQGHLLVITLKPSIRDRKEKTVLYRTVPRHHVNGKPICTYTERFQNPCVNVA